MPIPFEIGNNYFHIRTFALNNAKQLVLENI
jgi:hypothetical protein